MTRPKYLVEDVSRHGKRRLYVRFRGKKVRIFHDSTSYADPSFVREYQEAMAILTADVPSPGDVQMKQVRKMVDRAKKRARQAGREHDIREDDILDMLDQQEFRCAVSGLPFDFSARRRNPRAPSIDRIDCARGYTRNNVRLVLTAVNTALSDWGDEEYRLICKAVTQNGT